MDFKTCEVMQYIDYYDDFSLLESRIKQLPQLNTYAFILHDKDVKPDGTPKQPHFHLILTFKNNVTDKTISKILLVETQFVNKIKTTTSTAHAYLVHLNDPEKAQYDPCDVVANFDFVAKILKLKRNFSIDAIIDKIVIGEVKEYNITQYVDGRIYSHNKNLFDKAFVYRQKSLQYQMKGNRNMECVFITGDSGTGKTTFAKQYAEDLGFHYLVSSGGKNPLDDYKGEECIIMDDLRPDTYSFPDLLKLTDNNTSSLVGCRYYNKSILECKLIIVTSCKPIDYFYQYADGEDKTQILRRFGSMILMRKDTLDILKYDQDEKAHVYVKKNVINPMAILYKCASLNRGLTDSLLKFANKKAFRSGMIPESDFETLPETQQAYDMSVFDDKGVAKV